MNFTHSAVTREGRGWLSHICPFWTHYHVDSKRSQCPSDLVQLESKIRFYGFRSDSEDTILSTWLDLFSPSLESLELEFTTSLFLLAVLLTFAFSDACDVYTSTRMGSLGWRAHAFWSPVLLFLVQHYEVVLLQSFQKIKLRHTWFWILFLWNLSKDRDILPVILVAETASFLVLVWYDLPLLGIEYNLNNFYYAIRQNFSSQLANKKGEGKRHLHLLFKKEIRQKAN